MKVKGIKMSIAEKYGWLKNILESVKVCNRKKCYRGMQLLKFKKKREQCYISDSYRNNVSFIHQMNDTLSIVLNRDSI